MRNNLFFGLAFVIENSFFSFSDLGFFFFVSVKVR